MEESLVRLKFQEEGKSLYWAGLPHFNRNFTRDVIIAAILMNDMPMLRSQLEFSALRQGTKKDSVTAEEPGKIFHEYPGVTIRDYSTEYNACDTTALFLLGHEIYRNTSGDLEFAKNHEDHIRRAVEYIENHLTEFRFVEDPKFSGAKHFALKVTYWKDSEIYNRATGEPAYPVVYPLAHIQNVRGLQSAFSLLGDAHLGAIAKKMGEVCMSDMFNEENGNFFIAIDMEGKVSAINSDSLHALFYLEKDEIPASFISRIIEASYALETSAGYMNISFDAADKINDVYHSRTVWPFEQALIHSGAKKHLAYIGDTNPKLTEDLKHVLSVSSQVVSHLEQTDTELFSVGPKGEIAAIGCNPQLWTLAAKKYFSALL
ncbi:hypothetical protein KW783_00450 [Candidatus Parcubacteria bacterium]|nr:hypothetical protein [Candidatus Parcubacteria bacterium]